MKIVAKDIEVICLFSKYGLRPLKFKYQENDDSEYKVIKIDKVLSKEMERPCGNVAFIFDCQSEIDGVARRYQIKYFLEDVRWLLFRM
jgi:hypothetical protein